MLTQLYGRRASLLLPLLLFGLALAVARDCQATIMRYLEVEDLTRISAHVFHGQVVSTSTYWSADHTKIYTAVQVQVIETLKGSVAPGQTVTVTQLGGEKDGVVMDFDGRPSFAVGEQVVLFTENWKNTLIVVALKQGKMRVEGQEVVRDFSGLMLVDKNAQGKGLRAVRPKQTHLTFDELRGRVAATK